MAPGARSVKCPTCGKGPRECEIAARIAADVRRRERRKNEDAVHTPVQRPVTLSDAVKSLRRRDVALAEINRRKFERIAVILRNEGIISTGAASEIAGLPLDRFVKKYGIKREDDGPKLPWPPSLMDRERDKAGRKKRKKRSVKK